MKRVAIAVLILQDSQLPTMPYHHDGHIPIPVNERCGLNISKSFTSQEDFLPAI